MLGNLIDWLQMGLSCWSIIFRSLSVNQLHEFEGEQRSELPPAYGINPLIVPLWVGREYQSPCWFKDGVFHKLDAMSSFIKTEMNLECNKNHPLLDVEDDEFFE